MQPADVLVTNDDGIDSPGLHALAELATRLGLRPAIAAPATESSGTSAGLTAATDERRLAVERRDLPGLPGTPAFAVAGHPGLITFAGCGAAFGPRPDVVLFGAVQRRFERLDDGSIDVSTVTVDDELEPGTDAALLAAGHPTITSLRPVTKDAEVDLPDRWFIDLPVSRSAD